VLPPPFPARPYHALAPLSVAWSMAEFTRWSICALCACVQKETRHLFELCVSSVRVMINIMRTIGKRPATRLCAQLVWCELYDIRNCISISEIRLTCHRRRFQGGRTIHWRRSRWLRRWQSRRAERTFSAGRHGSPTSFQQL